MEPSERLEQFLLYMRMPYDKFAEIVGCTKGSKAKYVGKSIPGSRKSTLGRKFKEKFSLVGLNYTWYLTGDGEMLSSRSAQENISEITTSKMINVLNISNMTIHQLREYRKIIQDQANTIDKILEVVDSHN